MGSVKEYFSNLGSGIASLLKGMQVTGKEFVTPKITEEYPDNRDNLPVADRFRAVLTLKYDDQGNHKCIACGTCERVCPNNTISLDIKTVDTWDGKKKKKLDKYMYDLGSCTFCQLCVTNCPTDALEFSNDFEQAVFTRGKLLKKLNYLPEKEEPQPTPEEIARMKAEKEAKIAAAKAAAEAKKAAAAGGAPKAAAPAAKATPAPEANDAAAKALAAAAGDPVKEAKIRAALEKAAALKAQREAGKTPDAK
ncbi:MAG: NADH-quinone oxidoreductase subunit I [Duncaniella sp.]|nr:NADH-quinone oxidoreductase subunit I [Duncaniella sp.]MDE7475201.1 NADH-quinone oxidoreductase subunit I [Duncaniella sp.]